jgi:Spy/CpxP family protein refolding chaperone
MDLSGRACSENTTFQNRRLQEQMENMNLIRKGTICFSLLAVFGVTAALWAEDDMKMGNMAPAPAAAAPAKAMGMCCMGEMGMPPSGGAGMTSTAPAAGMPGMSGAAGMPGMSGASGMAGMNGPSSATPGQPGSSHMLHMGSTGFFLNHSQHITLTADQKSRLNRLKEKTMLDQASEQRKIDQGEQELYTLTGADQPDNTSIQAKIGEVEKLRGEQRMNFIKAVGEASKVLTPDQHQALMMGNMGAMPAGKK